MLPAIILAASFVNGGQIEKENLLCANPRSRKLNLEADGGSFSLIEVSRVKVSFFIE